LTLKRRLIIDPQPVVERSRGPRGLRRHLKIWTRLPGGAARYPTALSPRRWNASALLARLGPMGGIASPLDRDEGAATVRSRGPPLGGLVVRCARRRAHMCAPWIGVSLTRATPCPPGGSPAGAVPDSMVAGSPRDRPTRRSGARAWWCRCAERRSGPADGQSRSRDGSTGVWIRRRVTRRLQQGRASGVGSTLASPQPSAALSFRLQRRGRRL
jgi:hypothetical protein